MSNLTLSNTDTLILSENILKATDMSFSELISVIENFSSQFDAKKEFVEQVGFAEILKLDELILKGLIDVASVFDNVRFDIEKRKKQTLIITDQVISDLGTRFSDNFSIVDEFSRHVFIGIIDIEGIAETLVKDFGFSVIDSLAISEQIDKTGQVEPLKRKTYLFTKGDKSYLFHRITR